MKFDHLIHIYWIRIFLINGFILPPSINLRSAIFARYGLSNSFWYQLRLFFEDDYQLHNPTRDVETLLAETTVEFRWAFNSFMANFTNINISPLRLEAMALIRLFFLKTYRGRRHALHFPMGGQRTRSNWRTVRRHKSPFHRATGLTSREFVSSRLSLRSKKIRTVTQRLRRKTDKKNFIRKVKTAAFWFKPNKVTFTFV